MPSVEREIVDALPPGSTYSFHLTSVVEGEVERATKPEAIALGVFGVIAGLAALLIGAQAISRRLWANRGDLDVLRSLGADTRDDGGRRHARAALRLVLGAARWRWASPCALSPLDADRSGQSGRPVTGDRL